MYRVLVPFALIAAVTAGYGAPVPKHLMKYRDSDYMPTAVGTKWVYEGEREEYTEAITAAVKKDTGTHITVSSLDRSGKAVWERQLLVSEDGVWETAGSFTRTARSPRQLLKFPHVSQDTWENEYTVVQNVRRSQCTAFEAEEVVVPAGKFRAIRVTETRTGPVGPTLKMTTWYAAGIGPVKFSISFREWALKSYTTPEG